MRALLILAAIIGGLCYLGYIQFSHSNGEATMSIQSQKLQDDATKKVDDAKAAVDRWQSDPNASPSG
jgi:predicted negative regulator of RcsB-dependent stress response